MNETCAEIVLVVDYFAKTSAKTITLDVFPSPSDEYADWREQAHKDMKKIENRIYLFIINNW